ncbi:DUF2332 domain-containing protein [Kitasatospora sp. MBT63]|uniref:DUF2332 domain-containing protein n=1 Tax=Kitasatospora sp. MBT63 TaxID=1444768 RepID=UPI0009E8AC3B|nr:DUF2332 domain-containing protein [Kitasatospora sp. MBT63]
MSSAPAAPGAAEGNDARANAIAMVEQQARACAELGSPLYAALLHQVALDLAADGPCAAALAGHEADPWREAVALRLLGGVHALVLTGRAPELAAHYPSAGGSFDPDRPDAAWPAFRAAVADNLPWVRDWLTRPPQTNEVGRANLLITGLLHTLHTLPGGPRPVRLYELGASAGLNLLADRFRCEAPGYSYGPEDSPVVLAGAWEGRPPELPAGTPPLDFAERRGCDLTPIDPRSPGGALALRAYLWADQPARVARLNGALRLAAEFPTRVEAVGAAEFLRGVEVRPGAVTVVWHSVMRQYVPAEEWAEVERESARLAASATAEAPYAHIAFEPRQFGDMHRFVLAVRIGEGPEQLLAEAAPHGLPARTADGLVLG